MKKFLLIFGPGLLVAATGVGAGDLATSALAGSKIGLSALIAIMLGGVFKYVLNEGLARWQFCTGSTLIEGAMRYYGKTAQYLFMVYLLVWSFTVAVALMSACGIAMHAILPFFSEASTAKIVYGAGLSLLGVVTVRVGGFKTFERLMSFAILLMVVTVIITVVRLEAGGIPGLLSLHLFWPEVHELEWFIAVLGGVGGTVTILCYGYWLREHHRQGEKGLKISRIDLALAYFITALLGMCMVLIGNRIEIQGGGATLLVQLSEVLESESGQVAGWLFRIGAFAAVFSSLLGVWQSVPYLFADLVGQMCQHSATTRVEPQSLLYNRYLYGLAIIPMIGLPIGFAHMQKLYALSGAAFVPLLALTLVLLHFQSPLKRHSYRNPWYLNALYLLIFLFFIGLTLRVLM